MHTKGMHMNFEQLTHQKVNDIHENMDFFKLLTLLYTSCSINLSSLWQTYRKLMTYTHTDTQLFNHFHLETVFMSSKGA